jgi:hypothetical protein
VLNIPVEGQEETVVAIGSCSGAEVGDKFVHLGLDVCFSGSDIVGGKNDSNLHLLLRRWLQGCTSYSTLHKIIQRAQLAANEIGCRWGQYRSVVELAGFVICLSTLDIFCIGHAAGVPARLGAYGRAGK